MLNKIVPNILHNQNFSVFILFSLISRLASETGVLRVFVEYNLEPGTASLTSANGLDLMSGHF